MATTTIPAPAAHVAVREKPKHSTRGAKLTALDQVCTPKLARWLGRLMLISFISFPFFFAFAPWQQSFHAYAGRVIALDPTERQQNVEAPIDGRILYWHVREGQEVKAGDKMVSIQDPDPELPKRLKEQRVAILERITAANDRITSFDKQIASLQGSLVKALEAGRNRLSMSRERLKAAEQAVVAAEAQYKYEAINFRMERDLQADGLTSRLNYELAVARRQRTEAELNRSKNSLNAAKDEVNALEADLGTTENNINALIAQAQASRQSAQAELASARRDLQDIDIRISRQDTQEVTAPCDGVVFRILANAHRGGALVKAGETLAIITPKIQKLEERNVELYLSGNDAPQVLRLIRDRQARGDEDPIPVRVQFEGWPAVQFVGWPSLAWGTFGGKIVFVDPHDDGKGRFRIIVAPDENDDPWPDAISLRQGTRAQGWVLLDRVPLWFELWRRFNGFPPVMSTKDDDGELKPKAGKVKVPK